MRLSRYIAMNAGGVINGTRLTMEELTILVSHSLSNLKNYLKKFLGRVLMKQKTLIAHTATIALTAGVAISYSAAGLMKIAAMGRQFLKAKNAGIAYSSKSASFAILRPILCNAPKSISVKTVRIAWILCSCTTAAIAKIAFSAGI